MMHPHPSSLPYDYHRLQRDELAREAEARRLAGQSRRRTSGSPWRRR